MKNTSKETDFYILSVYFRGSISVLIGISVCDSMRIRGNSVETYSCASFVSVSLVTRYMVQSDRGTAPSDR